MKKRNIVTLALSLMLLVGCEAKETNEVQPEDNQFEGSLYVEDIVGEEGVYCLHADGTISTASTVKVFDDDGLIIGGVEPLVIDRAAGDQLIYIGDMVYLGDSGSDMFKMDWSVEKYYWSGHTVDFFEIEEFEGIDISGMFNNSIFLKYDTEEIFAPMGLQVSSLITGYDGEALIISKEKKDYTYGYFEGTEWIETTDSNNIPYYDLVSNGTSETDWEYVFSAPVIKGKEGYFTIDLSAVEAGMYLNDFDSGQFDEYVFDIK